MNENRRLSLTVLCILLGAALLHIESVDGARADTDTGWQSYKAEASAAYRSGNLEKAIPLAELAYESSRALLGESHPDTLGNLLNLAFLYHRSKRYEKAETGYAIVLDTRRRILGNSHPETIASINNLAILYDEIGKKVEAEKLFKEVLQASSGLDDDHPYKIDILIKLAARYYAQERYTDSEPLLKEALRLSTKLRGDEHNRTLSTAVKLAMSYIGQGKYSEAEPILERAVDINRKNLGRRHPNTVGALMNLSTLYQHQYRYEDAESVAKEVVELYSELYGDDSAATVVSQTNLAGIYSAQARLDEAETVMKSALETARSALGQHDQATLQTINNLCNFYQSVGRLGKAESFCDEALEGYRTVHGDRHTLTAGVLVNLANVYYSQGRTEEAGKLDDEALGILSEVYREKHSWTLSARAAYGVNLIRRKRYSMAEAVLADTVHTCRELFGAKNPVTIMALSALATGHTLLANYGGAERVLQEMLPVVREFYGNEHPLTLDTLGNIGSIYARQGRLVEAESYLQEALDGLWWRSGTPHDPAAFGVAVSLASARAELGKQAEAVSLLHAVEPYLFRWIDQEVISTRSERVRRQIAPRQGFQDLVITLGVDKDSVSSATALAADTILRFYKVLGEHEAILARVVRRSADQQVQLRGKAVADLRARYSFILNSGKGELAANILTKLEKKEQELIQASPEYLEEVAIQRATHGEIGAALPAHSAVVAIKRYTPVFGDVGEPHWAIWLQIGSSKTRVLDAGAVSGTEELVGRIQHGSDDARRDAAAAELYARLFARIEPDLARLKAVYVVPDGILNLVPFGALRVPSGQYWEDRQEIRLLDTAQDILRAKRDQTARGLLALGNINFGSGFAPLRQSGQEVERIAAAYEVLRKGEPVEVWTGDDASEARLKARTTPVRVLHLATQGFYLPSYDEASRPLALGGIALTGATKETMDANNDGVLYGLEVQDLRLDGTELVVLSACDTARGAIDYGEGVYSLARALRIAGASQVILTLWPVDDANSREFMVEFYRNWLSDPTRSDAAAALRRTRLAFRQHKNPSLRDQRVWAPYVLIGAWK